MDPFVRVGQIVGAFGLKGQVKVQPLTEYVERLDKGARLRLRDQWVEVEKATWHKNRLLLKLEGIDKVEQAQGLQWEYLEAMAGERPELEEDEFLADDLVGLSAVTVEGEELGKVDEVLPYPAQDILQIGDLMVPLVKQFVKEIDLERGVIVLELLPGFRGD